MPHESPLNILIPLVVLALLGWVGGHFWPAQGDVMLHHTKPWFVEAVSAETLYGAEVGGWVDPALTGAAAEHAEHLEHSAHSAAVTTSFTVVGIGIALAVLLYVIKRSWPAKIAGALGILYETVRDKYYIDEFIDWAVHRRLEEDRRLPARLRRARGRRPGEPRRPHRSLAGRVLSPGSTAPSSTAPSTASAALAQVFGSAVRLLQSGRVQQYAAFAVAGGIARRRLADPALAQSPAPELHPPGPHPAWKPKSSPGSPSSR